MARENNNLVICDSDTDVFQFLKPDSNTRLSDLKGIDIQDLIILLDDYYIQLRDKLGLNKKATFGFEIECEKTNPNKVDMEINKAFPAGKWSSIPDGTLNDGTEIRTPVLKDLKEDWQDVETACSIIRPLAEIGTCSGGHIHVGAHALGNNREAWLNFIKLWSVYENIIFRFGYGDYLTARPIIGRYARPISKRLWQYYSDFKENKTSLPSMITKLKLEGKYGAVNFNHIDCDYESELKRIEKFRKHCTIEFRCPNGSLDPAIWQNNVNLFAKMLYYSGSTSFDDDTVQKRHEIILTRFADLQYYDEIYLEQALEFCDIVFTNNLDKINFLKQYLKSLIIRKSGDKFPKSPVLTKGKLKK